MTRCRISEEDARDSHFDGEELNAAEKLEAMREDLEASAEYIHELAQGLLQDSSWSPDSDDIEAAYHLIQHLRSWYYSQHNRKKAN